MPVSLFQLYQFAFDNYFFSADGTVVQAGHLEKFHTYVMVHNDGQNTWINSATFKSTCNLNVQFFPFDKQQCNMVFGSMTADRSFMYIKTKSVESDNPEKGMLISGMFFKFWVRSYPDKHKNIVITTTTPRAFL